MDLVSVVIPVYKYLPNEFELRSFKQCLKVLSKHTISIICADSFNIESYELIAGEMKKEVFILRYDDKYFSSLAGYNKLLLSKEFYNSFRAFDYILIYQLDCWVFRDELAYWCNKGYDYIGAPWVQKSLFHWFETKLYPKELVHFHRLLLKGRLMCKVGNGGFSLRRVKAFIKNLDIFKTPALGWRANEDSFFAHYVRTFNPFFRIAPFQDALRFSYDSFPQRAHELNNYRLPFGCHGWSRDEEPYKGNMAFWAEIISDNELP